MNKSLLLLSALSLAHTAHSAFTPFALDFSTDPSGSTSGGGRTTFAWSASDLGVDGNPGRVNASGASGTTNGLLYSTPVGTFSPGDSITFGYSFLTNSNTTFGTGGGNLAALVLASSAITNPLTTDNTNFELVLRRDTGLFGADNYGFRARSHDSTTRTETAGGAFNFNDLSINTWYNFEATISRVGSSNDFNVSFQLVRSADSFLIGSFSTSFTNASIASASNLSAGFFALQQTDARTALAADNFSAIPEPSTYALLGLGLGALLWLRRRFST